MTAEPGEVFAINTYAWIQDTTVSECLSLARVGEPSSLWPNPGHLWPSELGPAERRAIRALLDIKGLRLVTVNMPNIDINIAAASAEMRRHSLAELSSILDLAGELGAEGMILGPGKPNPLFPMPRERLVPHFFAALDRLVPRAEAAGTAIWVENMPFASLPEIDGLMEAIEAYGDDRIGVCYDVANAHFIGEDLGQGLTRARDRLKLVHISDTGRDVYRHDPIGAGTVPVDRIPMLLAEAGYEDPPVLEIISRSTDEDLRASVERLLAVPGWRERTPGETEPRSA